MWMQSKTKMWHMFGFSIQEGKLPKCQSYNLDRPNYLTGEMVETPPEGAKVCKKCHTHIIMK
jgi:hypothetical protein